MTTRIGASDPQDARSLGKYKVLKAVSLRMVEENSL